MNIAFFSNVTTEEKVREYLENSEENHTVRYFKLNEKSKLISLGKDTEILVADAMAVVDREIINALPDLKLIQSEGVGYQGIDTSFAGQRGIPVCNNKGVNDTAVAEGAVLLMLSCLRHIITGNQGVYDGRQLEIKKNSFGVIRELSQCTVGLLGMGDIARMTAKFCRALGAEVIYHNRTRYENVEKELEIRYVSKEELLNQSDIVSLHIAVTPETVNTVNCEFLNKMKKDAFLINTARGDLVDNQALLDALLNGKIAGAGLDVIAPEPVEKDNILLDKRIKDKLVITPHIAGITNLTVKKIYGNIMENIENIMKNRPVKNRVN